MRRTSLLPLTRSSTARSVRTSRFLTATAGDGRSYFAVALCGDAGVADSVATGSAETVRLSLTFEVCFLSDQTATPRACRAI